MASEMERLTAALKKHEENVEKKKRNLQRKIDALEKKFQKMRSLMSKAGMTAPDDMMEFIENLGREISVAEAFGIETEETSTVRYPVTIDYAKAIGETPEWIYVFGSRVLGFQEGGKTDRFENIVYNLTFAKRELEDLQKEVEKAEKGRLTYVRGLEEVQSKERKQKEILLHLPEVLESLRDEWKDSFEQNFLEIYRKVEYRYNEVEDGGEEEIREFMKGLLQLERDLLSGGEEYCAKLALSEANELILRLWNDVAEYLPTILDWGNLTLEEGNKGVQTLNGTVYGLDREGNEGAVEVFSRLVAENSMWVSPHIRTSVRWL